ncbi:MAG: flagellar hook-length control protein FliK [Acidocella sp.]|nr:flagellar hook-length control protein FliK [Acidocella sp.]
MPSISNTTLSVNTVLQQAPAQTPPSASLSSSGTVSFGMASPSMSPPDASSQSVTAPSATKPDTIWSAAVADARKAAIEAHINTAAETAQFDARDAQIARDDKATKIPAALVLGAPDSEATVNPKSDATTISSHLAPSTHSSPPAFDHKRIDPTALSPFASMLLGVAGQPAPPHAGAGKIGSPAISGSPTVPVQAASARSATNHPDVTPRASAHTDHGPPTGTQTSSENTRSLAPGENPAPPAPDTTGGVAMNAATTGAVNDMAAHAVSRDAAASQSSKASQTITPSISGHIAATGITAHPAPAPVPTPVPPPVPTPVPTSPTISAPAGAAALTLTVSATATTHGTDHGPNNSLNNDVNNDLNNSTQGAITARLTRRETTAASSPSTAVSAITAGHAAPILSLASTPMGTPTGAGSLITNATITSSPVTSTPINSQPSSQNAPPVTLAPASLAAAVTALHHSGQNSIILRLDPPGLGTLAVHLGLGQSGQVNLLFVPAIAQTAQMLATGMDGLRHAMANAGLALGDAQIGGQLAGQYGGQPSGQSFGQSSGQSANQPVTPQDQPQQSTPRTQPGRPKGLSAYA